MRHKKSMVTMAVVIVVVVLIFIGYQIYRYPAMFRNLSDESLDSEAVSELRTEIVALEEKRVLVAYFSYSGTTRNVANALSERIGADLFEISPQEGYSNVYVQSNSEIRNNESPTLSGTVENMEEYDIVFIGYPVWWHATPAPINTFLESYDFTGKLVIPFCTSGGSDIEETMPTFLNSCQGIAVYGERRISGTDQIDDWLAELNLNLGQEAVVLESETADGKILVAYFSWSGNTQEMASYIAGQTGGELLELQPENPYPTDYNECGDVALAERDNNERPAIANLPDSIAEYETILIGYPIWWHTAPMIIGTFLESYDLTGIDVYPFTQSASMDTEQFDNSIDFVQENANGATVHDGLFARPSDTETIDAYLLENGLVSEEV